MCMKAKHWYETVNKVLYSIVVYAFVMNTFFEKRKDAYLLM